MQEHRTGARGNFTAFELPWSDIFKSLSEPVPLPQTGKRLRKLVQVILMTDGKGDGVDARVLSQATVRRDVVVRLIKALKSAGHRSYAQYDMDEVERNARALPKNAKVPSEVQATITKKNMDTAKMDRGKPAAPPDPLTQGVEDPWQYTTVSSVTLDNNQDEMDMNYKNQAAYITVAERVASTTEEPEDESTQTEMHVVTGKVTLAALNPTHLGLAGEGKDEGDGEHEREYEHEA